MKRSHLGGIYCIALGGLLATWLPSLSHVCADGGSVSTVVPVATGEVPVGGIILWWGNLSDKPSNFELCDGENGRPDLRGRFARGADDNDSLKGQLNDGGKNVYDETDITGPTALTIDQMPAHSHDIDDPGHVHPTSDPGHAHSLPMGDGDGGSRDKCADGDKRQHRKVETGVARTGVRVDRAVTGVTVKERGADQGHTHPLKGIDRQPEYQELFYLVRVL